MAFGFTSIFIASIEISTPVILDVDLPRHEDVVLLCPFTVFTHNDLTPARGTLDIRSYFFPLLKSSPIAPAPCSLDPPLRVYMYDLPRRFNVGMISRRNSSESPVTAQDFPPWPENWGLKKQHSMEYWMMGSLIHEGDDGERRDAIRVSDPELADAFFVPFFSSLSFNSHGHNMTDPETQIDRQLQVRDLFLAMILRS
ncbi:Exostosin-like [Sesbania bispinosa]|nr:Exostosin-like [Sesbania bispinosa]